MTIVQMDVNDAVTGDLDKDWERFEQTLRILQAPDSNEGDIDADIQLTKAIFVLISEEKEAGCGIYSILVR